MSHLGEAQGDNGQKKGTWAPKETRNANAIPAFLVTT